MTGIGFASMLMVNTINVTIQNSIPDALRGRVMSLYVTVFAGSAPIGGLLAGAHGAGVGCAGRVQHRRGAGGGRPGRSWHGGCDRCRCRASATAPALLPDPGSPDGVPAAPHDAVRRNG